jgi:hypothetical protein
VSPHREDLVRLVGRLSHEVDEATQLRDRLPLVRAYLAAVARLEALDAAALDEARKLRSEALSVDSGPPPGAVDELLERRRRRGRLG